MINPSIHGWIDKFFIEVSKVSQSQYIDEVDYYSKIRETGFVFGHIVNLNTPFPIQLKGRLPEEISKIGYLNTMYQLYRLITQKDDTVEFSNKAIGFYNVMVPRGFNPLERMLPSSSNSSKLEKIIHDRVQTNEDLLSKSFSHVLTNALLFVDVLAFRKYLENGSVPDKYFSKIENIVLNIISLSLKTKTGISAHDELLNKLFESSVRYTKTSEKSLKTIEDFDGSYLTDILEKLYIIDLSGISLWSDDKVENEERFFLFKLGEKLSIPDALVLESIHFINAYIKEHRNEIPYFNFSNPVKNFYDQTINNVQILIKRNSKRLITEISESKELMQLLAKSTNKDLSPEEKKKVKKQLLDICKSIPSLTIFLLPGGGLLLPILIKFIPKLLPSAFNENLND